MAFREGRISARLFLRMNIMAHLIRGELVNFLPCRLAFAKDSAQKAGMGDRFAMHSPPLPIPFGMQSLATKMPTASVSQGYQNLDSKGVVYSSVFTVVYLL